MLEYLINIYVFVADVYMDNISDMICHLYKYFIQKQHDQNDQHLCMHSSVSTSDDIYYLGQEK